MADSMLRVFVNERAIELHRGATVRDAVQAHDPALAGLVDTGAAYVMDATGRTVDGDEPVTAGGTALRVVVSARAPRLDKARLRRWPKVELHVHLDGSLRPQTVLELAREQGVRLPADTPEGLRRELAGRNATSLEDYLVRYDYTLAVLQTAAALERAAYEFVLDVAEEQMRYVEVRYSPLLHRPALTLTQAIEAPLAGVRRAAAETGTRVGIIVCGIRTRAAAESLELARAAADYRDAGVVAFDLAGAERGHAAGEHRAAFEYAAAHGLARTCHAGEGDGPASIRDALERCGAQRLGHGTRLLEDPALEAEVIERRVPLEMCVSSNVHTRTVAAVRDHPFRRYLQRGAVVTLNTDGRLIDGVTLTDEYYLAHATLGVTVEELTSAVLHACEGAFLPDYEKVALASRVQSEIEALR